MSILVFGDSITYGLSDERGGWVARLRGQLEKLPERHIIYNLGIPGERAAGVVSRLALETQARSSAGDPLIIVIAIGINDTKLINGEPASTTDLFKGELEQILATGRQYADKLLFVGLSPVDDAVRGTPNEFGTSFQNDRVWEFEKALREFCDERDLQRVELYELLQGKRIEANVLADGLHPNASGHQLIAERVWAALQELR